MQARAIAALSDYGIGGDRKIFAPNTCAELENAPYKTTKLLHYNKLIKAVAYAGGNLLSSTPSYRMY